MKSKGCFSRTSKSVVTVAELVINWDQTGLSYVPVSEWTMEKEGAKQIPIDGKDNKHQIIAVFDWRFPSFAIGISRRNVSLPFSFHQTGISHMQRIIGVMRIVHYQNYFFLPL